MSCVSCHNSCVGEIAYQKGTYIAVRQMCSHCGHKRIWMSQPSIRDVPAGNILLSAGILFAGATPGKILRLLNHIQVACISERTFYRHQSRFLEPAVLAVWEVKQSRLLAECKACATPLSVGGDGRADSPGHSAKYGSYGLINLNTNKVIHIQLVQVIKIRMYVLLHCLYNTAMHVHRVTKSSQATTWKKKDYPGV